MIAPREAPIVQLPTTPYRTERLLRLGPHFDVYLARDLAGQADVNLHVLHADLARSIDGDAFVEAALALGRIEHRHLVPVFDARHADGIVCYVTPHLASVTARDKLLAHGPAPLPECARILSHVSAALACAHKERVYHGSLVPESIRFDHDVIMVEGVGIRWALLSACGGEPSILEHVFESDPYAAPEDLVRQVGEGFADVYSLGAVLHELITGAPPRDEAELAPQDRPEISRELATVVMRCLGSDPGTRFADAVELSDYLSGHGEITTLGEVGVPPAGDVPDSIGPYRVLGVLGEGGMGVVYMAEQAKPLRRRVAVKVVKPGMNSREVLRRFEVERQALAMVDHVGIARVYDAGATASGCPYFSMEVVPGEPLTTYCDEHRLGTRERVALFIKVCEAIQHAHQRAIIHRDLKPSNVLVAERSGRPEPKVIDFGLAKAMGDPLIESAAATRVGQMIGTPDYMSPEQFESAVNVDTRTDVYSLGVILYELLVGALPYGLGLAVTPMEAHERIVSADPPTPSVRLVSLGDGALTTARRHGTDPMRLAREVRGDLDWITMKALERDRMRRYATVSELMQDLLRHLGHEPVTARPPTALYQLGRWARRNQVVSASAVVGVVTLVVGLGIATTQMVRARRAERVAAAEAQTATAISDLMFNIFSSADPRRSKEEPLTVSAALDVAVDRIDEEFPYRPEVKARLLGAIGDSYQGLGDYDKARLALEKALALTEEVYGEDRVEVADVLLSLGLAQDGHGLEDEALRTFERSLAIYERQAGPADPRVADLLFQIAFILRRDPTLLARSDTLAQRSLGILEGMSDPPGRSLTNTLRVLAAIRIDQDRFSEAAELVKRAQTITGSEDDYRLAVLVSDLARVYLRQGESAEAEDLFRESLSMMESYLGPDHEQVATQATLLASAVADQGEYQEAEVLYGRALEINAAALGSPNSKNSQIYWNVWMMQVDAGRYEAAEQTIRDMIPYQEELNGLEDFRIPILVGALGDVFRAQGRYREAVATNIEALRLLETRLDPEHPKYLLTKLELLWGLGTSYEAAGDLHAADTTYLQVTSSIEREFGPDVPDLIDIFRARAGVLRQLGRPAEADSLEARAQEIEDATESERG